MKLSRRSSVNDRIFSFQVLNISDMAWLLDDGAGSTSMDLNTTSTNQVSECGESSCELGDDTCYLEQC